MILYHQTANNFAKFDLTKARPGAFGVGIYFVMCFDADKIATVGRF